MNASKLMVVGVALSLSAGAFAGGVHGGCLLVAARCFHEAIIAHLPSRGKSYPR